MSEIKSNEEKTKLARRRFIGAGAGLLGLAVASRAEASGWNSLCRRGTRPCFLKGTNIATANGETAVEKLAEGDLLQTASGQLRAIKWIGVSRNEIAAGKSVPAELRPIRIAKDAIAHGMPHKDLLVSPDHAMFIDGVLIPAKYLVNGVTITIEPAAGWTSVDYYHVELESHDVILAEGAHAETYRAFENRHAFDNAAEALSEEAGWIEPPCAPFLTMPRREMILADVKAAILPWRHTPSKIESIRNRLADRANAITAMHQAA